MSGFDTHIHSTASDGHFPPAQLVAMAKERGLIGMALTDHDTVAGIREAVQTAAELDFPFIPGIELSAQYADYEVHILGYWIDWQSMADNSRLQMMQDARMIRCEGMVKRLSALGMKLDMTKIVECAAAEGGSLGRPHVAQAMVDMGYAENIKDAFTKWLSKGMPAYIPRLKLDPLEAVAMIKSVGGVAALAHPGAGVPDMLIPQLVRGGIGGIEVYHSEHNRVAERKYLQLARKYRLAALGGSDFHVHGYREIGSHVTTVGQLAILAEYKN